MGLRRAGKLATNLFGLLALATSSVSCGDLSLLESGACGNFVIDLGEDCDGHPLEANTVCAEPGKPNACRQVCEVDGKCPVGWGCGADGICRQPSGSFAQIGDSIPIASEIVMYPGDFDGDRATDVLVLGHENSIGTRPARIIYPNPTAGTFDTRPLSTSIGLPAVGHVDDDGGLEDIAFGSPDGVSLLENSRSRDFEYGLFPFFTVPDGMPFRIVPMDVFPEVPGDEFIALVEQTNGQTMVHALEGNTLVPLWTLPTTIGALNPIGQAKLDASTTCKRLVIAARGAKQAFVYSPCRTDGSSGWNKEASSTIVNLPAGLTIGDGVLVTDLDLDGYTDILINTSKGPHAAWCTGNGAFISSKAGGSLNLAGPYEMDALAKGEFPLVAADLNGDVQVDFVLPHALLVSRNGGSVIAYENVGAAWTAAAATDLNANGLTDVIAGSHDAIDLTFLNNAGAGVFNPATVPTDGPVAGLTVGDFDGDLINDVAVGQSFLSGSADQSVGLSVRFGQSHGPPTDVVQIGRIENLDEFVSTYVPDPGATGAASDTIADLLALDKHTAVVDGAEATIRHLVLFRGNGSHVMRTAQALIDEGNVQLPVAMGIAKLGDNTAEIVALGADAMTGRLRLWVIEGTELESLEKGATLSGSFHPFGNTGEISFRYGALMASGNLDADKFDEIVVVAPYGQSANGAAMVIFDYDSITGELLARPEKLFSASVSFDSILQLRDVDGDGNLDAVLSTGTHEELGGVIIFWGDGHGDILTTGALHVDLPGGIRGFTCLPEKRGCRLILGGMDGTYVGAVNAERRLDVQAMKGLPRGLSLATGDFDRDGVPDLAVHTLEGLKFFRSVPVNP